MPQSGEMHNRKFRLSFVITLVCLILIPVLAYVFLFRVNQFYLEIRPLEGTHTIVDAGTGFTDPGAETYLVGTLIARNGIPVTGELTVGHNVDVCTPGDYPVVYTAGWKGLESTESRLVTVRDVSPPTIRLTSLPGYFTMLGEEYREEGYSAWDDCDGDLTASVTRVNDGEFVTYIVTDNAGNRTSVSRKIHYYDPVVPEIRLLGETTVYVKAGDGFVEPGWVAQDNVDGDISHWVKADGQVDKYRAGTYQISYSVYDSTGNQAQVVRNVIVQSIGIPETVNPEGKVIYLTFDDGPGPYTRQLLAVLEKYGAKATFFVVNSECNDVLADIARGGHSIGIHSVTHDYREIYASADAFFHDLLSMQQIIYDQTGVMTHLMRFPGGSSNTVSRFNKGIMSYLTKAVEDNGFRYFDWNVDSDDAGSTRTSKKVFENVISGVQNRRISIVLQHDIKDYSVAAVEKILIWGLENGYQFLCLDMTSPMAHHGVNN